MNVPPNREVALFSAALELDASQRGAYLDQACADDPALRLRLEALLRVHEEAIPFLETPAPGAQESPIGAEFPGEPVGPSLAPTEKAGDRIGRYKLLEQIGEGGCGAVYMAEQEEPVRRRVALKVIKLGMDTKQVIARFEAERQALALMDHPNIAKVFDAGATDTGRPYFVMELVRGVKITDFCDQNKVSTEDRLKLFIQVCQAIQHAHQKGIIHRDIKPSNILVSVSEPGAPGCPKVIDFGIAKAATGQRLTDKTVFTAFEQFIGTPAYMSPEQAMMTSLDIDTRTDVYALGVLLYELLTGKTPFEVKRLLDMGLDEIRRIIREEEPVRPSTRLSTMAAADLTEVANQRHAEPAKLGSLIRGDLDWIVMKSLEKDRARRYETANGLARDIQRHLDCEPVAARPPSRLYEFQKTVRRHKFGFAAAVALITVLAVGVLVSTLEAFRAKTEAAKATTISDFLQQLLSSANPDALKGSEYTVRQLLDDFSAGLENQLHDQPEVEAAVRATIGRAYQRLGVADKAQAHHERALTLRRRIFGNRAEPVAESLVDYTWTLFEQGQYAKGEPFVREALDIYRKRGTAGQPVISALWVLQKLVSAQGRITEMDAVTEDALTIAAKSPGVEFPEMASMIHGLAEAKNAQSQYAEAESLALKAVAMHRRSRGAEHPETAWALQALGVALKGQKKLAEAEAALREALRIFRKYYSAAHKSVDQTMNQLKLVLEARGDSAGIEALYREILAGQRAATGNDSPVVVATLGSLAASLYAQGKRAEAEKTWREAMVIVLNPRDQDRAKLPLGVRQLGEALKSQGKSQDAERLFDDAINLAHQQLGETNIILGELLHQYGEFLFYQENNPSAAVVQYLKSLPIRRLTQDDNLAWTLRDLGSAQHLAAGPKEAEPYFRESLKVYRRLHPQEDISGSVRPATELADTLYQQQRLPEAESAYRDALAAVTKCQAPGSDEYAVVVRSLLDVLKAENKLAEAEALCHEILAQQRAVFTNDNRVVVQTLITRAGNLAAQGKPAEAEPALRETLRRFQKFAGTNALRGEDRAQLGHLQLQLSQMLVASHRPAEAERLLRDSMQVFEAASKDSPNDWFMRQEHAYTVWMLAEMLEGAGRLDAAESEYGHAIALHQKAQADFPNIPGFAERLGTLNLRLIELLRRCGKLAEAATTAEAAAQKCHASMAQYEKLASDLNHHKECWSFAISYEALGQLLQDLGENTEAERTYRDTQVLWRKLVASFGTDDDRFHLAVNYDALGSVLSEADRAAESLEAKREAQAIWLKSAADSNLEDRRAHLGWTDDAIGQLLQEAGRFEEATEAYQQALAVWRKLVAEFKKDTYRNQLSGTLVSLATTLQTVGKRTEAGLLFREASDFGDAQTLNGLAWQLAAGPDPKLRDGPSAVVLAEKAVAGPNRKDPMLLDTLAAAYAEAGQFTNAIRVQQEAIALLKNEPEKKDYASRLKLYENNSPYRDQDLLAELASERLRAGEFGEAEPPARECLTLREREIPDDWRTFNARSMLGGSLLGQKKYAEAEPLLLSGYEGMKQREVNIPRESKPRLRETLQRLVRLYEATKHPDQAAEWKRKLEMFTGEEVATRAAAKSQEPIK